MLVPHSVGRTLLIALGICTINYTGSAREPANEPGVVVHYCSGCHGRDGNSQLPYVPRLAGLSAAYLESRLATYRKAVPATVDEPFARILHTSSARTHVALTAAATEQMVGMAKRLSEDDLKAAARWYSAQRRASAKSTTGHVVEQGRDLYMKGLQSRGVPACQSCHGPEGRGTEVAPQLAGQHAPYVVAQLTQFRTGARRQSSMTNVARSLEPNEEQALAAYLQSK